MTRPVPLRPVLLYLAWAYTAWSLRVLLLGPWERAHFSGGAMELYYHLLREAVWLLPIPLVLRAWGERGWARALALAPLPPVRRLLEGLAWAALYLLLTDLLQRALAGPPSSPDALAQLGVGGALLTLLSAAEEELVFRGFLRFAFEQRTGPVRAALLTSLLFALIHVPGLWLQLGASPAIAVLLGALFVLGLALSLVTRRSGSLWPAVLLHALNNLFAALYG
ncbi:lysostaphin resistance A-like protein [Aggregicoccus sp. 17bor-14]|uniref:CPBP family intramembrane glutamic endopeptidase n=1 Tax=Myxococcaceae TaxID=31 RepID=UPI00351A452F